MIFLLKSSLEKKSFCKSYIFIGYFILSVYFPVFGQSENVYIGIRAGLADIAYQDIAKEVITTNKKFSEIILQQYSNLASAALEFYIPNGKHGLIQFEGNFRYSDPNSSFVGQKQYQLIGDTTSPTIKVKSQYYYFRLAYGINCFDDSRLILHFILGADFGYGEDVYFNDALNTYSNYYNNYGAWNYNSGNNSAVTKSNPNSYSYYSGGNYIVPNPTKNIYLGGTIRLNVGFYLGSDKIYSFCISPSLSLLKNIESNQNKPISPDISLTLMKIIE